MRGETCFIIFKTSFSQTAQSNSITFTSVDCNYLLFLQNCEKIIYSYFQCTDFVKEFEKQLIELIIKGIDSQKICEVFQPI